MSLMHNLIHVIGTDEDKFRSGVAYDLVKEKAFINLFRDNENKTFIEQEVYKSKELNKKEIYDILKKEGIGFIGRPLLFYVGLINLITGEGDKFEKIKNGSETKYDLIYDFDPSFGC